MKKKEKAKAIKKTKGLKTKAAPKIVKKVAAAKAKAPAANKTAVKAAKISPAKAKLRTATVKAAPVEKEAQEPKKAKFTKEELAKFRKLLLELRDHLIDGVSFLASDNLKRSNREVSGDLSGYSLHMADAGTDNFDREFALSLVSNEQEALYEIEEALKRIEHGQYGLCEMCEKPVMKERLEAVPFARMCVHCQSGMERNRRRSYQTVGIFTESAEDGGDGEDSEE
jgi:RNA polymerase-binding protein DksA